MAILSSAGAIGIAVVGVVAIVAGAINIWLHTQTAQQLDRANNVVEFQISAQTARVLGYFLNGIIIFLGLILLGIGIYLLAAPEGTASTLAGAATGALHGAYHGVYHGAHGKVGAGTHHMSHPPPHGHAYARELADYP